jgi:hypothetical protein
MSTVQCGNQNGQTDNTAATVTTAVLIAAAIVATAAIVAVVAVVPAPIAVAITVIAAVTTAAAATTAIATATTATPTTTATATTTTTATATVGTLKDGYVYKEPLLRAPRIQHASHASHVTWDIGYLAQVPDISTWSDLTGSLAGLGRRALIPFPLLVV